MPARPGLKKASPSSETPCRATIARVVSESASWIARRSRLFGAGALRAHHQPERDAGAGQQQRGAAGGPAGDPEEVGGDVHASRGLGLAGSARDDLDAAVVEDEDAAVRQPLAGALGPGEQRRLRVDLGQQGGGRQRGRLDDPGEGRLAGAGSRMWWAAAVGARPRSGGRCRWSPRRRRCSASSCTGSPPKGSSTRTRRARPRAAADADVAAAVDRVGRRVRRARRRRGRRADPWRCRRCRSRPRRPDDRARRLVDADQAPARGRAGGRGRGDRSPASRPGEGQVAAPRRATRGSRPARCRRAGSRRPGRR